MAILVFGLGATGLALTRYFHSLGETVWGLDDRDLAATGKQPQDYACDRWFLLGEAPPWQEVSRFFVSPGIDPQHPLVQAGQRSGKKIEGELDLAFSLAQGKIIAITGTNGKSTTTSLVGLMLQKAGLAVGIGGNLGTPFLDLVRKDRYDHYVLELSSFQLEQSHTFHPHVAALLNLSEDHFDRHPSLHDYLEAKRRIFQNQQAQDYAVYNDDDLHTLEAVMDIPGKKIPFSTAKKVHGVYGREEQVQWAPEGTPLSHFSLRNCQLKGLHNLENICAALACAKALGLPDAPLQAALEEFRPLPHRLELVSVVNQVSYFDDSKGTNVGAVVMSLASFEQDVVLILGGKDKGGDYSPLKPLLKAKARALIVMGEAKEKILASLGGVVETIGVDSMEEAVRQAALMAPPGGTVLLSPACSSFDRYRNYHERGEDFRKWVKQLDVTSSS